MKTLELKLLDVIHHWREIASAHAANHSANAETCTLADMARNQAVAVHNRCDELERKISQWKAEGLL